MIFQEATWIIQWIMEVETWSPAIQSQSWLAEQKVSLIHYHLLYREQYNSLLKHWGTTSNADLIFPYLVNKV